MKQGYRSILTLIATLGSADFVLGSCERSTPVIIYELELKS